MKRSPIERRTPLRQRGRKAMRDAEALADFQRIIRARSRGLCEARTPACPAGEHAGSDCHHMSIAERRMGLHNPDHGLLLCRAAHAHVHANPAEAYEAGWLMRGSR